MRVLIALSCLLAITNATWLSAYHIPVIGPHGVPLDEPAVAHARAEHLQAHAEAAARAGHGLYAGHGVGLAPAVYGGGDGGYGYAPVQRWHGPIHIPVINALGVPVDEPAVQHARAEHLAAHGGIHGLGVWGGYAGGYGHGGPVVPHETPEVAAARAAHLAAHAHAAAASAGHYRRRRSVYGGYQGPLPVIGHDGVPQDEPAVAAARAHHFQAFQEAASRNAALAPAGPAHYGPAPAYQGPQSQYEPAPRPWHGPIHIPVLDHNGVPVEPHENQAARASHAAAFNDVVARQGGYRHY